MEVKNCKHTDTDTLSTVPVFDKNQNWREPPSGKKNSNFLEQWLFIWR